MEKGSVGNSFLKSGYITRSTDSFVKRVEEDPSPYLIADLLKSIGFCHDGEMRAMDCNGKIAYLC
jgi:hypothetical protein